MKYMTILTLRPGVEAQQGAVELFAKIGVDDTITASGTGVDGKRSFFFSETDGTPPIASTAAYGPFFDIEVIPVVDLDEAWFTEYTQGMAQRD